MNPLKRTIDPLASQLSRPFSSSASQLAEIPQDFLDSIRTQNGPDGEQWENQFRELGIELRQLQVTPSPHLIDVKSTGAQLTLLQLAGQSYPGRSRTWWESPQVTQRSKRPGLGTVVSPGDYKGNASWWCPHASGWDLEVLNKAGIKGLILETIEEETRETWDAAKKAEN
ncbi:hypothetical protein CPC735_067730 [Coccidioides posadasii C735 delta SOWgp]|uniref:Uncharacterized protein n=1 Tax=Coccidioides posadasii (strain C735) TaxID=222929 RepID=C5PCJ6_COCP7|nr:hypothetical protein CPC735_067730 [Coccidioides posadasii C735 delta SOWgp]EER25673.1 hypothetical protein CPC735_067730 [Coccidioides posadasii C735 delta SOWgp]|eukprot:XP_003067818.1 hypothetical protein CPC735_067730 [Coccidioides posadasii C735 delta SOWgp]